MRSPAARFRFFPAGLRPAIALVAALLPLAVTASPPVAPTEALSPAEELRKFRLPEGFAIELVAAEPDIQKPMNLAFDARGRLWVTHSIEYPFAPKDGAPHRDGITVLSDFGPDGRARKAVRFADDLNIPIGVLPLGPGDEVLVWSIPNIWKLSDTDGDGKADAREILYGPFDFVDTHGDQNSFRLGPDGWVYACHGFRNDSKVRLRGEGEVVLSMQSGNTYRFRPDGSAIEQVTWGQVNPFGMCFDALGNQFSADCHSKPVTMLLRGAYYESFGKPHDGLGYAPSMTGHDHGSTGIAGALVYDDPKGFPAEYQGNLFVGNVITNTVHRDRLGWKGSSPWVDTPEDFLVCDDWWFRPVDLQLGPDGALYIADFYNCIIGHYEVDLLHPRRDRERGRIWRVIWKGDGATTAGGRAPTDTSDLPPEKLFALLGHDNQTVRQQAFERLLTLAPSTDAVGREAGRMATDRSVPPGARALATWLVARLGRLDAQTAATIATDDERAVRVHLVKALDGTTGWDDSRRILVSSLLDDDDPFVRRATAEALGAHPAPASLTALLAAWRNTPVDDAQLVHALRIAIRNQLRPRGGVAPLAPDDLANLDLPTADLERLVDVAVAVPDDDVAWSVLQLAGRHDLSIDLFARSLTSVARHSNAERLGEAAAAARARASADTALAHRLFAAIFEGHSRAGKRLAPGTALGEWGAILASEVLQAGGSRDAATTLVALTVAEQLRLESCFDDVAAALTDRSLPADVRSAAGAALLALSPSRASPILAVVALDAGEPATLREGIFRHLGGTESEANRETLCEVVATAPPSLRQAAAWALASRPEGAERLMQLVAAGKTSGAVLQYGPVSERLRVSHIADLDARLADLTRDLPPADEAIRQRIDAVAAAHRAGGASIDIGRSLFNKNCAQCHRLGGFGPAIGPQLDGIGQRGSERLLEDLLDPSRNVDEAFRLTTVITTDGRAISGLKLRENGGDLVLADTLGKEVIVPAGDIEEIAVSRLSPMPANVAELIGEENIPHLLEFLLQQREPAR
jgi:putative heme-binding domain-containing protein